MAPWVLRLLWASTCLQPLLGAGPTAAPSNQQGRSFGGEAKNLSHLRPKVWSRDTGPFAPSTCELPARSGRNNGVCTDDVEALRSQLSFCREAVRYRACVPAHQPLWDGWNASKKDAIIADLFKNIVDARLAKEMNVTPDVYVELHMLANADCIQQYKNVLCWHNFPKCDDFNVSLPLCRRSCARYYEACKYLPSEIDGLYDACREEIVDEKGLFNSETPGVDQVLAEDLEVCESTKELAASIPDEEPTPTWYTTWWGMTVCGFMSFVVAIIVAHLLLPEGLRVYISWKTWRIITTPKRIWRSLPVLKGKTLAYAFAALFAILVSVGVYRRVMPGPEGGFERFKLTEEWLTWYDTSDGWTGGSHQNAVDFCQSKDRRLCSRFEMCRGGALVGGNKTGDKWTPYSDAGSNAWVQVGNVSTCKSFAEWYGHEPDWGKTEAALHFREYVACCQAPLSNLHQQWDGVGKENGGTCTCPDGLQYTVGDHDDTCASLACYGGMPGKCYESGLGTESAGMGVVCAQPFIPNDAMFKTSSDLELPRTVYKQLITSCSCTGAARRGTSHYLALVGAWPLVPFCLQLRLSSALRSAPRL